MPQDEFRIFLSAVSSEFGKARDAVAADLRAREAMLRVQSDFRQEARSDTTLKKLHDYIRDCSAVVCVIGKRSGERALSIDVDAYGPNHATVAIRLNNLAGLLQDTNPLSEAEPLLRRALAILARFTRATGHQHPSFELFRANYVQAPSKLSRTEAEIEAALKSLLEDGPQPPP